MYRENNWTKRKTEKHHCKENQKPSRKLNERCIAHLHVMVTDNEVDVEYLPIHTNHTLAMKEEAKHLPLPLSVKTAVSEKLLSGVPIPRILQGSYSYVQNVLA